MLDVNAGHPARRRAGDPRPDHPARPVARRRPALDRLLDRRGPRGRASPSTRASRSSTRVTGEEERLERVLPLIRKYGAAVVAISNDDTGISRGPRRPVRGRAADRRARGRPRHPARGRHRRPAGDADRGDGDRRPAGLPARAPAARGARRELDVRRVERELRACPIGSGINAAFLPMAIASGLTSAITNPLAAEVKAAIMAADVLMGNDQDAGRWIRAHREPAAPRRAPLRRVRTPAPTPHERRRRPGRRSGRGADAADQSPGPRGRAARRDAGPRGCGRQAAEGRGRGERHAAALRSSSPRPAGAAGSADGTTVLDAARSLGVDLDSVCGGRGLCGRCQVVPAEGAFPKHGIESSDGHLSPRGADEDEYDRLRGLAAGSPPRLPRARPRRRPRRRSAGEPGPSTGRAQGRAGPRLRHRSRRPALRGRGGAPRPSTTPGGDLARLLAALATEWGLDRPRGGPPTSSGDLQPALEAGDYRVTVAVHDGRDDHRPSGRGCTIGRSAWRSTSARRRSPGHLANLADGEVLASDGVMNPQIRFGEDLMSRVSYAMLHEGGGGGDDRGRPRGRRQPRSRAWRITSRGRHRGHPRGHDRRATRSCTTSLLGIDPMPLGSAPFALATDARRADHGPASWSSALRQGARVYLLPCIAGHVGADSAGAILAETPYLADEVTLLVDVGTNAEIVLGYRERLLAASSPDGPGLRGRPDLAAASGPRRARSSVYGSTSRPWSRASSVIGSNRWSDEVGLRGLDPPERHHRRLRLGHRRGHRRAVPRRASSPPTAPSTGRSRPRDAAGRAGRPDVRLPPPRGRTRGGHGRGDGGPARRA